jgi:Macrocin-O-methyltransferase (TylF)
MIADLRSLYLETVKRSVAGLTHEAGYELRPSAFDAGVVRRVNEALGAGVRIAGRLTAQQLALIRRIDDGRRAEGGPWPLVGETMIGARRLDHLQRCVETVLHDAVPGDLIEAGVWRGGAVARRS